MENPVTPRSIIDYIHQPQWHPLFKEADAFKYALDYRKAAEGFKKIFEKELQPTDSIYALNHLAFCYLRMNEDSLAEIYLHQLEPDTATLPLIAYADYLYNRGLLKYARDEWKEAISAFQLAAHYYSTEYGVDHLRYAQSINRIGIIQYEFAMTLDSALQYIPLAYELFQAHPEWWMYSKENEFAMALLCQSQRNHRPGEMHCDNALSLAYDAAYTDSIFLARCLNLKANMLKMQGRSSDAVPLYWQAINMGKQTGSRRVQEFYMDMMLNSIRLDSTEIHFYSYLDTLENLPPWRKYIPDLLRGYYHSYFHHTPEKIIAYYEKFLRNYKKYSLRDRVYLEEAYYALGKSYTLLGQFDLAYSAWNDNMLKGTKYEGRWMNIRELTSPDVYRYSKFNHISFFFIAEVFLEKYKKLGHLDDLLQAYELCLLAESLTVIPSHNEHGIITYLKEVGDDFYQTAIEIVYLLYQKEPSRELLDHALLFTERMKSYLLYRDMQPSSSWIQDSIQLLNNELRYLTWLQDKKGTLDRDQNKRFTKVSESLNKIFAIRGSYFPPDSILTVSFIQKKLKPDQSLVEYSLNPKWNYTLFINRDTVLFYRTRADNLYRYITPFLECLSKVDKDRIQEWIKVAHGLYQSLISPFESLLKDRSLLIIADRQLNLLPFEALIENDSLYENYFSNAPYFLKRGPITYSPSWKVYLQTEEKGKSLPPSPRILAYTYGEGNTYWLKESEDLINQLPDIFNKKNVTLGKQENCSKKHFLQHYDHCDILHFSIHAESNPLEIWDNKLLFRPGLKDGDTLYSFQIMQMKFRAKLAVLGACVTAFGHTDSREGTYSLSRAFLQAGIPQVLASLWEINQAQSAELLSYFYREISDSSHSAGEALHQAKLTYLKNADNITTHPGYWSGIICIE